MVKVNLFKVGRLGTVTASLAFVANCLLLSPKADGSQALLKTELPVQAIANSQPDPISCPTDVRKLTTLLLKDLPGYSNRVIQRTQDINQSTGTSNYIITASEAEFEPIGLPQLQYDQIDNPDPTQVFFSVLERQYLNDKIVDIQTYHWLFLVQTESGWRTVMMFSRFGNSEPNMPSTPPRESTNGIIGQGVKLWLKDCRAGTIRLSNE